MKSYVSKMEGWIAGRRVAIGDLVILTDAQAQYEPVTPVQNPVPVPCETVAAKPASTPLKSPRKQGRLA